MEITREIIVKLPDKSRRYVLIQLIRIAAKENRNNEEEKNIK